MSKPLKNVQRYNSLKLRGDPEKDTALYIESKDPEIANIRIRKHDDYWTIDTNSLPIPDTHGLETIDFSHPQDAARMAYTFFRAHRRVVADIPIPTDIYQAITRILDNERRSAEALRTMCFDAERRRQSLIRILKLLKVPAETLERYDDESPLAFVDRLTLEGEKVPFFSEAKMYELVGKEDARTILAAIRNLKRAAEPVRGAL